MKKLFLLSLAALFFLHTNAQSDSLKWVSGRLLQWMHLGCKRAVHLTLVILNYCPKEELSFGIGIKNRSL